jgi:hypothetical protein
MSNFETFTPYTQGLAGTAPMKFVASTTDSLATILAAGYLNDLTDKVKANDSIDINYADTSVSPTVITATYGTFQVVVSGGNTSLVQHNGIHAAKYTNAGGSATVSITDSAITTSSVVVAAIQSSANAVTIEKVTPGSGTLTVLCSGDPGASVISYIATANVQ